MLTDAQLMQQVQAGACGLFDELILRHRPGLLRFAGSMLADADAAKDPDWVAGATALIAHNAYHLGEIRQALGWLAESG